MPIRARDERRDEELNLEGLLFGVALAKRSRLDPIVVVIAAFPPPFTFNLPPENGVTRARVIDFARNRLRQVCTGSRFGSRRMAKPSLPGAP